MTETWAYYDANTIQVTGDLTSKYWPYQLIKITQGVNTKWFIVTAVNLVSGNTRLSINGGGSFTLTNEAISGHWWNAETTPQSMPLDFISQTKKRLLGSKTSPVDADELILCDSADSWIQKKLTWAYVKSVLKTYFDGIYIFHSLATAENDFLVASGSGAFIKKTLAEVKTILGLGTAAYTASTDYATLVGVSGGQTLEGDTASGGSLTLSSTHHATKGKINFGSASAYDQATAYLGIGDASPSARLTLGNVTYTSPLGTSHDQFQIMLYHDATPANTFGMGVESGYFGFATYGGYRFYQYGGSTPICQMGSYGSTDFWLSGNCSALSFTDRTPAFIGNALDEIKKISHNENKEIDHATLPDFVKYTKTEKDSNGNERKVTERNVGNMVSLLTNGMQELIEINKNKDKIISELTTRISALEKKMMK